MVNLYEHDWNFLQHPFKWLKEEQRLLRWRKQRLKFGFCDLDWWDMDIWMLEILPAMLRKLAAEGNSYPGTAPFDTWEKWHNWLLEQANLLENAQEDKVEANNEYSELWYKFAAQARFVKNENGNTVIEYPQDTTYEEVRKNYMDRMRALAAARQCDIQKAFNNLGTMCLSLWD